MIKIRRFDASAAFSAHEGTILGSDILPEGMEAPFSHNYGYLRSRHTMMGHSHPTDEIYHVMFGRGTVILNGENKDVSAGDVIFIPAGQWHTMSCGDGGPLLWGAYWWPIVEEGRSVPEHIAVKRFHPENAYTAHEGTILADKVCPEGATAPFRHQYGHLKAGKSMEGHAHKAKECYVVTEGYGFVTVGDERRAVSAGDVVEIPVEVYHTMTAGADGELTWFALWWE